MNTFRLPDTYFDPPDECDHPEYACPECGGDLDAREANARTCPNCPAMEYDKLYPVTCSHCDPDYPRAGDREDRS